MLRLLAIFTGLLTIFVKSDVPPPNSVPMKIKNFAGAPIELFWINVYSNDELVKQTTKPIRNASDTQINSYDGHAFMVKFFRGSDGNAEGRFVKGPREESINVGYNITSKSFTIQQITKFDEVMQEIKVATSSCDNLSGDEFSSCVADGVYENIDKITESKARISKYRDMISNRLRNYTCADLTLNTSTPISTANHYIGGKLYTVDTLFETDHGKIWAVHDFVTDGDCERFRTYGEPRLQRATVAGEDGTSTVSPNRKAQQAGYELNNSPNDPLWDLYHRTLHLTNKLTGFRLQPGGQEGFTIIQYNKDDEYTPHCDGSCDSSPYNPGGRVATAVMYCKVAELGGGTTFSKADVFVKPVKGMATFFSYRGADNIMDEGYTEHSGCPVLQGEKWITTFWMREGVSEERDWTTFDPSGVPILDSSEYDDNNSVETEVEVDG